MVNYNKSLTWNKAILGWFPLLTMIPVRSQWGRYNLPRFIGSNYIHVMAVILELVQPARVRMCSGFQFENTNTKKNMLKGPWFSLISSQVMEAVWNSGCCSWILGILVDNCKCWTGLWNMRIKAKPSQSSDLAKKTKLAKISSHWLIAINKNWYQTSKPGDTGFIISTKQTKEWIAAKWCLKRQENMADQHPG